jgi:hypothetical protein
MSEWYDDNLSQWTDEYPFYRFFTTPLDIKKYKTEIEKVNEWVYSDNNMGLLLTGTDDKTRSQVLYLVARVMGLPISFSSDIVNECIKSTENYREDGHFPVIERLVNSRTVIDRIGEEPTNKLNPVSKIIEGLWKQGKGVIGATSVSPDKLKVMYGDTVYNYLMQSTIRVGFKI